MDLSAQKYYSFDTINISWNEIKEINGAMSPPNKIIESYFISGDTLIEDNAYFKIYRKSDNDSNYIGCFREKEKKIFYIGVDYFDFDTDSAILLYDFTKNVNDTVYTGTWHSIIKKKLIRL